MATNTQIQEKERLSIENSKSTTPDFGLSSDHLQQLNEQLAQVLADEYVLYTKLRKFHWQVKGMSFAPLHQLFEEQYQTIIGFVDEIAEQIQIYGGNAPATLQEFTDLSRLDERPGITVETTEMLHILVNDHESIIRFMRKLIKNNVADPIVEDRFIEYITAHQKLAWMLRSHIAY